MGKGRKGKANNFDFDGRIGIKVGQSGKVCQLMWINTLSACWLQQTCQILLYDKNDDVACD